MSRSSTTEGEDMGVVTNNGVLQAMMIVLKEIVTSTRRFTYEPVMDVASPDFKIKDTMFQVSQKNYRGRHVE
eukprot:8960111-Ditylum_brightwellii.AAC.1